MMDFSSRQLRAFLLVAQHRSFTRAAAALFITPSGLSLLIRELENQLGFRLFDRTTRQVVLTVQGGELLAVVRKNLDELDAAMTGLGRTAKAARASISVGAPPWSPPTFCRRRSRNSAANAPIYRSSCLTAISTRFCSEWSQASSTLGWAFSHRHPVSDARLFFGSPSC